MSYSNKYARSALTIIIFSLASKLLGFIREILIAAKFGSGMDTDAFFIASAGIGLITSFLTSVVSTTFIPVISEVEAKEGKNGKIKHTNNMINIILLVTFILLIITLITSPIIVKILAIGFEEEQFTVAVKLIRIGLPMILFSGVIGVLTGYLQSEERFNATAIMGLPMNISYIFFLLVFSSKFGIKGLMISVFVGVIAQLFIQFPEVKASGFKYRYVFNLKDIYIRKVLDLSLSAFFGLVLIEINEIVDKTLASSLVSGSISALNYANKLNRLILGVFISAITTVIFPVLSKEANSNNIDGVKKTMGYGINLILLITIPATVGLTVLAKPIVEIAFQRGEFDSTATLMTSQALIFYSVGLVSIALQLLLTRVYYSLQDTKTPMINGAISVGFNIILNLILVKFMDHAGLALATSIAITISALMLFYGLKKKIGSLGTLSYIKCGLKVGLASAIMGIVAYATYHGIYDILGVSKLYNLISLLVAVGLAVIVYGILCYLFWVEEVRDVVNKVKMRLKK